MSKQQNSNQVKEKTIAFEFTLDDINRIMGALGNLPYVQVYQLINKIQVQAGQQVSPGMEHAATGNGQPELAGNTN